MFKSLDEVIEVADSKNAKVVVTGIVCAGCKAKDEIIEELNAKLEVRRKYQRELMRARRGKDENQPQQTRP